MNGGGILDGGPVEPVPILVSRPEVGKGGTVFIPEMDVAFMFDGWLAEVVGI